MDCNEAVSLINPFLKKQLKRKKEKNFISHVLSCKDCYDELEVRFLVEVTKNELSGKDEDMDYNFSHALSDELQRRERKLNRWEFSVMAGAILLITVVLTLFYYIFYIRR